MISKVPCTSVQMWWCHDLLQSNAHRLGWLAGVLDALLHGPKRDWISARGLTHLLGPTEKALQGHKARAVAYEQTFEQTIRLEAAVLGW